MKALDELTFYQLRQLSKNVKNTRTMLNLHLLYLFDTADRKVSSVFGTEPFISSSCDNLKLELFVTNISYS